MYAKRDRRRGKGQWKKRQWLEEKSAKSILSLDIFFEEAGDVLEFGDVVGINLHEQLVRFEAGAGEFFLVRIGAGLFDRVHGFAGGGRSADDLEQVYDAQIVEHVGDAFAGIQQLQGRLAIRIAFPAELQTQPSHNAQESAIHQLAFGEFQDEPGVALLPKGGDQGAEIDAALEAGTARDTDAHELVPHRHLKISRPVVHDTSSHVMRGLHYETSSAAESSGAKAARSGWKVLSCPSIVGRTLY
jgi:hypothetical protein